MCHVYSNVEVINLLLAWNRNTNRQRCATQKSFLEFSASCHQEPPPPLRPLQNVTSHHATCWWVGCGGLTGKFGEIDTGRLTRQRLSLFLPNADCRKTTFLKGKPFMRNFINVYIFAFSIYCALLHFISHYPVMILLSLHWIHMWKQFRDLRKCFLGET